MNTRSWQKFLNGVDYNTSQCADMRMGMGRCSYTGAPTVLRNTKLRCYKISRNVWIFGVWKLFQLHTTEFKFPLWTATPHRCSLPNGRALCHLLCPYAFAEHLHSFREGNLGLQPLMKCVYCPSTHKTCLMSPHSHKS